MSVIVRNNPSVGVGGSTSKGFPPGDVSNIIHTVNDSKVLIKWTDPEDTIVDEAVFVKWKGTLLIRNSDHYPTSIKDGDIVIDNTIKNKYKDNYYEDTGLTNNTTYYYRFFPYSEDKVYNDTSTMIFKAKPLLIAPVFKDNTWEQIIVASESNSIPDTWKIGDEIDLVLSGNFNETVTMQIWDFNHFDKTDGTGKAGICFGMKNLMKNMQQMNNSKTSIGGWNESYMRNTVMVNIYNSIPIELRNHIKEVHTEANIGGGGHDTSSRHCTDKVFLPGSVESGEYDGINGNQVRFPIFTDNNNSRIKKMNNGLGAPDLWWTRSPYYTIDGYFTATDLYGKNDLYYPANNKYGVCFCFNV